MFAFISNFSWIFSTKQKLFLFLLQFIKMCYMCDQNKWNKMNIFLFHVWKVPAGYRLTLCKHKSDNKNRIFQLTEVSNVYCLSIDGIAISDYNKRLILLSVIQTERLIHYKFIIRGSFDSLISQVNFTNILRAAFAPIFLHQKSMKLKFKYIKALPETFAWQSCAE